MRQSSFPRFLTYPEAVRHIGPLVEADWTGTEHVAPSEREDAAELHAVFELDAAQLKRADAVWRQKMRHEVEQQRASGAPQSGIAEAIAKLKGKIAETNDPKVRARFERVLNNVQGETLNPRRRTDADRLDDARSRLAEELLDRQKTSRAARHRWNRVSALLRDKVFAGELRAAAHLPHNEVIYPTTEQWKAGWPDAGETRARVPHQGFELPTDILFSEDDLDCAFPATSKSESLAVAMRPSAGHRLEYKGHLEGYLANPKRISGLSDLGIARKFRVYMRRNYPDVHLPKKTRDIVAQLNKIRAAPPTVVLATPLPIAATRT